MHEPLVVLIYNKKGGYQTYLEQQLADAKIERHDMVIDPFSWRTQLIATRDAGLKFPYRLLLVIDAWDQVLLGSKRDLTKHAESALLGHVTLAGAKNCWPDDRKADYLRRRGPEASPWQYINNSPLAGLGRDIAASIDWGLANIAWHGNSDTVNDPAKEVPERFWTRLYLDGPSDLHLRIDTQCELNQIGVGLEEGEVLIKRGRIYNTVTETWPIFLHLNGGMRLPMGLS